MKNSTYSYDNVNCSKFVSTASLKTLLVNPCETKPGGMEKEYSILRSCHKHTLMSMSFSWRILILYISFLNVEVDNNFVNKFSRLSLEHIC